MSFRQRLTLFFLLIVVLPMVAVAVLVTQVTGASRTGKADARLATGMETALSLYREELDESRAAARRAASDEPLVAALRSGRRAEMRAAAERLVRTSKLSSLAVLSPGGREIAAAGAREPVAQAELSLRDRQEGALGSIRASYASARSYIEEVRNLTGNEFEVAVLRQGDEVASTVDIGSATLPAGGGASDIDLAAGELRVAGIPLTGAGQGARLALFGPIESGGPLTRPVVAGALALFFAIALLFIAMLLRALQGQVAAMLGAARRIGSGDFSRKVPVEGRDEMAGLASEFNKMSDRLSRQMNELREQRAELERSIRRVGEAFASGLDRVAVLEVVARTALAACHAQTCRVVLAGREKAEAQAGAEPAGDASKALRAAESSAMRDAETAEATVNGVHALAQPLAGARDGRRAVAVMSIARRGDPFDSGQREMLRYLVSQASVSVENVDLHELVSEQAITDELTGLSNRRRFHELMEKEAARAQRFSHELSLLMLDIDDFKHLNDTYGHLQGDEVLRTIGRTLKTESRVLDEPARYGGEEFVVALPETGTEGALELAERIRTKLEQTEIPRVDSPGSLRVTASLGIASIPTSARDALELIAAADAALYRAKRAGKNRCTAAPAGVPDAGLATQGQATEPRT